jgi:putative flippase GtrA
MAMAAASRFGTYALIGGIATGVHYGLLVVMVANLGITPGLAAATGATAGALAAYVGNRQSTFTSKTAHRRALPRFLIVAAIGVVASGSLVWAGTRLLGLPYLIPQLLATALVLCGGFTLNRHWTFT